MMTSRLGGSALLGLAAVWAVFVEIAGRFSRGDGLDVLLAASLGVVSGFLLAWHRHPLSPGYSWVRAVKRAFLRGVGALRARVVEVGVDFRREPPLPRGVPPLTFAFTFLALGFVVITLQLPEALPARLRELLAQRLYLGYLVPMAMFWCAVVSAVLFLFFLAYAILHDRILGRYEKQEPRTIRPELAKVAFLAALVLTLAVLVEERIALLVLLGLVLLAFLGGSLSFGGAVLLSYRRRDETGELRVVPLTRLVSLQYGTLALALVGLGLLGRPATQESAGELASMAVTHALSRTVLWAGAACLTLCVPWFFEEAVEGFLARVAAIRLPAVHVLGVGAVATRKMVSDVLRGLGFRARFVRDLPGSPVVAVRLVLGADGEGKGPLWPLEVGPSDLGRRETGFRLQHRRKVLDRRLLLRRLQKLFKIGRSRTFEKGEGFWIGLQHWFVPGLARDEAEDETDGALDYLLSDAIGPLFRRLFDRGSRRAFGLMMHDLRVDVIFVEDGVAFRHLREVLRVLFDIYDQYGGQQIAEDRFFVGLQAVRVLIHEVEPDGERTRSKEDYPEPDYREIGRGRILHVFRKRSDGFEDVFVPDLPEVMMTSF